MRNKGHAVRGKRWEVLLWLCLMSQLKSAHWTMAKLNRINNRAENSWLGDIEDSWPVIVIIQLLYQLTYFVYRLDMDICICIKQIESNQFTKSLSAKFVDILMSRPKKQNQNHDHNHDFSLEEIWKGSYHDCCDSCTVIIGAIWWLSVGTTVRMQTKPWNDCTNRHKLETVNDPEDHSQAEANHKSTLLATEQIQISLAT